MKAVICPAYGAPEVLEFQEIARPDPKPNEIRIHVKATTVTVADIRVRGFNIPPSFWLPARLMLGLRKPKKPVLGIELAGVVDAVGEKVTRFKVGDEVLGTGLEDFGGYGEYACISADLPIVRKPEGMSFEEAAAIPVGARTAMHFLRKADIQPGQSVLVYGASGSVGTYAVQLAKHDGAHVTGVCSQKNADLVRELGADEVVSYQEPDWAEQLGTFDVVFVAVDKLPFELASRLLAPTGVYLNITKPFRSPGMLWTHWTTQKQILAGENPSRTPEDLASLVDMVEAGKLRVVMDKVYPFAEMVAAHRYVDKGHKVGNVGVSLG